MTTVNIETNHGKISFELLSELAPETVRNFEKLAKDGFYDGTLFHRIIPGFMIQGGDPNTKTDNKSSWGMGGPGYNIKAEFSSETLNISFNSKYLIDIASEVEDKNLKMSLKDSVSPVLIEDASDKNSYYVIMPMKI